jgi:hypothetical protein
MIGFVLGLLLAVGFSIVLEYVARERKLHSSDFVAFEIARKSVLAAFIPKRQREERLQ